MSEIERLEKENEKLRKENAELKRDVDVLLEGDRTLSKRFDEITDELRKLKDGGNS